MKLAKVDHFRCGQPAGKWGLTTYVWVPDEMTEHDFGVLCETARATYLDREEEAKIFAPPPPGYGPTISPATPDNTTVAELRAEYEAKAKAHKDYTDKQSAARKSFAELLIELSEGKIAYFWNGPVSLTHELSWGHNHGVRVEYGETKVKDFPPKGDDLDLEDEL
jgi:hypothetical protein